MTVGGVGGSGGTAGDGGYATAAQLNGPISIVIAPGNRWLYVSGAAGGAREWRSDPGRDTQSPPFQIALTAPSAFSVSSDSARPAPHRRQPPRRRPARAR